MQENAKMRIKKELKSEAKHVHLKSMLEELGMVNKQTRKRRFHRLLTDLRKKKKLYISIIIVHYRTSVLCDKQIGDVNR